MEAGEDSCRLPRAADYAQIAVCQLPHSPSIQVVHFILFRGGEMIREHRQLLKEGDVADKDVFRHPQQHRRKVQDGPDPRFYQKIRDMLRGGRRNGQDRDPRLQLRVHLGYLTARCES